jgi:filamentous hemagglutinin family protein
MEYNCWQLLAIVATILSNSSILACKVLAQITPDQTLGSENSFITPHVNINGISSDLIEGGAIRGNNLFHSFLEFNIDAGRGAYFSNPTAIQNIFSRVTGNNISQILGTLGVLGNANLFFINPNGILFGKNASLDLKGSFFGSTANSITFADGSQFSTNHSQITPLLTINVQPQIGLVFTGQPGKIINQSQATNNTGEIVGLHVEPSQNLVLLGGDIEIAGGYLTAEQGFLNLATVGDHSRVSLNLNNPNWHLQTETVNNWQNLSVSQQANIHAMNGGNINIHSGNLTLTDSSSISTDTLTNQTGGDINITSSQLIINEGAFISASQLADGQAGNLNINTGSLTITGKGEIGTSLVDIFDDKFKPASRSNGLYSASFDSGKAGDLTINTNTLTAEKGAMISSSSFGKSSLGGNLNITAHDSITVDNAGILTGTRAASGEATSGNLKINTNHLLVENGATVNASTLSSGKGGDLTINANSIEITGESQGKYQLPFYQQPQTIPSSLITASFGSGDAGNLTINSQQLLLQDQGLITTLARESGNSGDLTINATESVNLIGTSKLQDRLKSFLTDNLRVDDIRDGIFVTHTGVGNAGNINIKTPELNIASGGLIAATTTGTGKGGDLKIQDNQITNISEASILTGTTGVGNAGDLTIHTNRLIIEAGGVISTATFGDGQGGDLLINASENIKLIGNGNFSDKALKIIRGDFSLEDFQSGIFTSSLGNGNAGNLIIQTPNLSLENAFLISASTFKAGQGGDLTIDALESVNISQSLVITGTGSPKSAGDINITTNQLNIVEGGGVATSTLGPGQGGNLTINALDSLTLKGLDPEKMAVIDLDGLIARTKVVIGASILWANTTGTGKAGNLTIHTGKLIAGPGVQISTASFGPGNAGDLTVHASELIEIGGFFNIKNIAFPSTLETLANVTGNAGKLTVNTPKLLVKDGAQLAVINYGDGDAGNLTINAKDSIELVGKVSASSAVGGLLAGTKIISSRKVIPTGNSGNILINTGKLMINNGAEINVLNEGTGIAGNIDIVANSIKLNQGNITASTFSVDGGNIDMNIRDILSLSNNSRISTNAGISKTSGNGGNILINVPFVVTSPFENSDITANAFAGDGGKVKINAEALFGIKYRSVTDPTDLSDITASSTLGLQGEVSINTLNIDPTQGLDDLPEEPVNIEVSKGCEIGPPGKASFYNLGLGGYPVNPDDFFHGDTIMGEWVNLDDRLETLDQTQINISTESTFPLKSLLNCQ